MTALSPAQVIAFACLIVPLVSMAVGAPVLLVLSLVTQ